MIRGSKLYERSEDPVYAMEHDLPLDLDYYVENQLKGPIDRVFECVFPNYESNNIFHGASTQSIINLQTVSKTKGLGAFTKVLYKCNYQI